MTGQPTTTRHWTDGLWSGLVCLLFAFAAAQEVEDIHFYRDLRVLNWDIEAYYHYLPATFIHGDVRDLGYVHAVDERLHPGSDQNAYGTFRIPETGHDCLKYTYGVALFEAPLFFLAHAWCTWSGTSHAPDGYSEPYQLAVAASSILFVFAGLLLVRRMLLRYVNDRAAALALITMAFGTNLFFYSTVDSGMSHPYLFFLFALVLERTEAWHRSPTRGKAIGLGLAVGLIALTRPIDAVVVVVPLLWTPGLGWRKKWELVWQYGAHLILASIAAIIPLIPQFLYWKATTGHLVFYSYRSEVFNWTDPHIIDGLFGYRKGWFIYSPLVALGFLGLVLMIPDRRWRALALPVVAFFPLAFYGIFSWYQWWYGGGFGARPLVDTLPLLALPLAVLAEKAWKKHALLAALLAVVILAGVRLNMFQQKQFLSTIIRWDGMTKERYWEVWGHESWDGLTPFP